MTYQAITTKYLPATTYRGARIKASTASGLSLTLKYDYDLSGALSHWIAARALAAKLGWPGHWAAGSTRDGYVFVLLDGDDYVVERNLN